MSCPSRRRLRPRAPRCATATHGARCPKMVSRTYRAISWTMTQNMRHLFVFGAHVETHQTKETDKAHTFLCFCSFTWSFLGVQVSPKKMPSGLQAWGLTDACCPTRDGVWMDTLQQALSIFAPLFSQPSRQKTSAQECCDDRPAFVDKERHGYSTISLLSWHGGYLAAKSWGLVGFSPSLEQEMWPAPCWSTVCQSEAKLESFVGEVLDEAHDIQLAGQSLW